MLCAVWVGCQRWVRVFTGSFISIIGCSLRAEGAMMLWSGPYGKGLATPEYGESYYGSLEAATFLSARCSLC